jgi:RNA polymerase sigma factor (sigma-70 family)
MAKKGLGLTMRNERDVCPKWIHPESLSALLERYRDRVQRFIKGRMRGAPRHNIEEVCQETHLRLIRLLPGKRIQDLESYISRVAANVAMDFSMKDSRERERTSFDSDEVDRLSELAPAIWINEPQNAAEIEQELARITNHLPPHLMATLLLCERDGLTYEEAAKKLEKSPHTIKKWLADAKALCLVRANRR